MTLTPSYFIFCHRESHIQLQQQEINTCPAGPSASHHHEIQDIDTPPHYLAPGGVSEYAYIVKKGRLLKPSVNTGLLHWPTNHENHYVRKINVCKIEVHYARNVGLAFQEYFGLVCKAKIVSREFVSRALNY